MPPFILNIQNWLIHTDREQISGCLGWGQGELNHMARKEAESIAWSQHYTLPQLREKHLYLGDDLPEYEGRKKLVRGLPKQPALPGASNLKESE